MPASRGQELPLIVQKDAGASLPAQIVEQIPGSNSPQNMKKIQGREKPKTQPTTNNQPPQKRVIDWLLTKNNGYKNKTKNVPHQPDGVKEWETKVFYHNHAQKLKHTPKSMFLIYSGGIYATHHPA